MSKTYTAKIAKEFFAYCFIITRPDGSTHSSHGHTTSEGARRCAEAWAAENKCKLQWVAHRKESELARYGQPVPWLS
jgi:hypothetical protein